MSATQRRVLSIRLCNIKERGRNAIGRTNKGDRNRISEKGWKEMKVRKGNRGERNRYEINYEILYPITCVAQDSNLVGCYDMLTGKESSTFQKHCLFYKCR